VSCWIFVTGPRSTPTAEGALKRRLDNQYWPVGRHTKGVQRLGKGDRVLFYLAGKENRAFVGQAELAGPPRAIDEVIPDLDTSVEHGEWNLAVRLLSVEVWPRKVFVEPLVPQLKFITAKDQWLSRFAVGLISIGEDDFATIREAATRSVG
jgi:predicted RNA-binding protein